MGCKTLLPAAFGLFAAMTFCLYAEPLNAQASANSVAKVSTAAKFRRTVPLRDMRWSLPPVMQRALHYHKGPISKAWMQALRRPLIETGRLPASGEIRKLSRPAGPSAGSHATQAVHDPVLQRSLAPAAGSADGFTQPIASFDGLGDSTGLDIQFAPPDANAAVGEKYVIEMVNASFGIYDKSGRLILGPAPINALWTGFGGPCEDRNDGHPAVLYDQLAHRWILSQFAITGNQVSTVTWQCVAVSQSDDPTGAWYLYAFDVSNRPLSSAAMAVWPNAWYSANTYSYISPTGPLIYGEVFTAFDRVAMLAGDPDAQRVAFDVGGKTVAYLALPASLDGYNPPPAGAPGLFINATRAGGFGPPHQVLALRQLQVDWTDPSGATLSGPTTLIVASFAALCGTNPNLANNRDCLLQPHAPQKLDSVSDGLMYRLAYRNLGDRQALVVSQTVSGDGSGNPPAAIRWYELDAPSGAVAPTAWSIAQQGTFAPADGASRWLGSLAMDDAGDIALGYSLVGPDTDPSIAYSGRHAGDPAGEMTEAETILQAGGGDQTGTNLWGALSSMAVAPDDCTFWYTNEYYADSGSASWSTHLGAFRFPDCAPAPQGTLTGTVTDAASGQPIANAKVILDGDIVAKTDDQGKYAIKLLAGDYTLATRIFGYAPAGGSATITAGTVTEQDLQLAVAPMATVSGKVTDGSGHGWGLYTEIKVFTSGFGQVADVWSDPQTGAYSVNLPQGSDYTLNAAAYVDGYQPANATVSALSGAATQNFALATDGSCTAPGYYSFKYNENFNDGFPPHGWSVTNEVTDSPVTWRLNTEWLNPLDFIKDGNFTGGTGTAADVNPQNAANSDGTLYTGDFDSSLVSPSFPVTSLPAQPVLRFLMNYQGYPNTELDVDIRTDGGAWQNIVAYTTEQYGAYYAIPGTTQSYDLASHIPAGTGTVQLRWHYYATNNPHYRRGIYGQIDDVRIGTCSLVPGGLIEGQVTDENTGDGVVGAAVSDDGGDATQSFANAADPDHSAGYYILFAPAGKRSLTVEALDYQNAEASVNVTNDGVSEKDIALGAGRLTDNPDQFDVHVTVNTQQDETLSLQNAGSASAHFQVLEGNRPLPPATGAGQALMASLLLPPVGGAGAAAFRLSLCPPNAEQCAAGNAPWAQAAGAPAAGSTPGELVNTFFTFVPGTYGLGFNRDVEDLWVGSTALSGGDNKDRQFLTDGTPTGATIDVSGISSQGYEADMAYDDNTGTFWQIGISLTTGFCIYELDPLTLQATGRRICPDIGVYQQALAYDPTTNTWYSGDFNTTNIYHFDASGKVLDWANATGEPIIGLTYNPATGHLFATATGGTPDVGVWDTRHNYALLGTFSIPGLFGLSGAGLGHDCEGHLWIAGAYSNEVFEAQSGEDGWCDFKQIPWLSESPVSGTVTADASAKVTLGFDGTGRAPFTTTHSRLLVRSDTPYGLVRVPITVHWDAQPVDLVLTGDASPSPVHKDNSLAYTLTVENAQVEGNGSATATVLSYALPSGANYVSGSGQGVSCAAPSGGSAPAPASVPAPGTVICDLGTLGQGAAKTVTIAVQASKVGTLTSIFTVTSREPDSDPSTNSVTINTTVFGDADLGAGASDATIPESGSGTLHLSVSNAGPDAATDVSFKVTAGASAKLQSATSSQGNCAPLSGSNGFSCDLGEIAAGASVGVDIAAFGAYVGTATVTGQASSISDDTDQDNNVATATVTVSASGGGGGGGSSSGGGGGLGWLALVALLGLTLAGACVKRGRTAYRSFVLGIAQKLKGANGIKESLLYSSFPRKRESSSLNLLGSRLRGNDGKWIIRSFLKTEREHGIFPWYVRGNMMRKGWIMAVAGAAVLMLSMGAFTPASAQSSSNDSGPLARVTMAPQSSLSLLKRATRVGPHSESAGISLIFGLKLRNVEELKRFLAEVQDPRSAVYHRYLTPSEFTAEYGPTQAQVAALKQFLDRWGIEVTQVSSNRLLVHTQGSTAAYEHALEVRINDYTLDGRSFYSTEDSPRLPVIIAPTVANVLGLNRGLRMQPLSQIKAHYAGLSPQAPPPASTAYFNPQQIAKAYDWPDITNTNNGAGVSIAIMTAETPNADNPNYHTFWNESGLPDHDISVIPVGGQSGTGGEGETALDVEWSGAMAPGADINVYVSANASIVTFAEAYNQIVTDNSSQVMTTSWGLAEPAAASLFISDEQIFMQAAAQGISMFAAAGDNGAADCAPSPGYCPPGPNNADYPSSSVYITSANGTELTISDTSGTYGNEHAWAGTGGAISQLFDKPAWQTGPGVPADVTMRMNSDMAMNAGGLHPYVVYLTGPSGTGYYGLYGTSAVAPQLAGLFADGVSKNGGVSLGQSNKLLYDDVNANAGNYGTDFHDVTTGCNGELPDATPSCAAVNWDHPTGWGSPRATSLLSHLGIQGPRGTLAGTVTDTNGVPIAGAKVATTPGVRGSTTNDQGQYSFDLPVGSYTVTATDFGYEDGTATVSIADGVTATQDFQLQQAPEVTVSGHVTDGGSYGWGLYAAVEATVSGFGEVADVWTDPTTGAYSFSVPEGYSYSLNVTPWFDYSPASVMVKVTGDTVQDFALLTPTCSAPGYHFYGISEDFNGKVFPPEGWTKTRAGFPNNIFIQWLINIYDPNGVTSGGRWNDPNWTGGSGGAAEANSNKETPYSRGYDASLISPPIAVSDLAADPQITFRLNYQHNDTDALDVDMRADGGAWQTVAHLDTSYGGFHTLPGATYQLDLGPFIPASASTIQLRWRYYDTKGGDWYVQVDDIKVGSCETVPGGLVLGQVTDGNTGFSLVGATVGEDTGGSTRTIENVSDPNLPVGYYFLFAPAGERTLQASALDYTVVEKALSVTGNSVNEEDIALPAGLLTNSPAALDVHVMVNGGQERILSLQNSGGSPARYRVAEANQPVPPASGAGAAAMALTPSPIAGEGRDEGHSSSTAVFPYRAINACADAEECAVSQQVPAAAPASATATGPGSVVSVFAPSFTGTYGLGVNRDADNLWVGSISLAGDGGDDRDHQFLFDGTATGKTIDVSSFSPGGFEADMAYDDNTGMLWQIGSEDPSEFCIHEIDPASMSLTGRQICPDIGFYQHALAYDPLTNTWYSGDFNTQTIYHFDSSGRILDFKNVGIQVVGLTFNPATGHLFATVSRPEAAVHDVYVIDPQSGYKILSAFSIPGMNGGAGAGLGHDCAGHLWATDFVANKVYEVESGEAGWCAFKQIPWLSEAPASGTVEASAQAAVTLGFEGSGQTPFTTTHTRLVIRSNTPYGIMFVPLAVHWDPQPVDLVLTGGAAPDPVNKGNSVVYTLTVKNIPAQGHGSATGATLSYVLPAGASYVSGSGEGVQCAAPAPGSVSGGGVVSCDLGSLAQGASKTVTIAVTANAAGALASTFTVTSREPDSDPSTNSVTLDTTVIGTADLTVGAADATIPASGSGTLHLSVTNAGPDAATDVIFKVTAGASAKLISAASGQGNCVPVSGSNGFSCALGEIASGGSVGVDIAAFGAYAGAATVTGQASTSSTDPNPDNNLATATVTVSANNSGGGGSGGSGGGSLGWLALAGLFGLAFTGAWIRGRRG